MIKHLFRAIEYLPKKKVFAANDLIFCDSLLLFFIVGRDMGLIYLLK